MVLRLSRHKEAETARRNMVALTRAQYAQRVFHVQGKRYSLKDYPYVVDILNRMAQELVLYSGRQVTKSTILAVLTLMEVAERDFWSTLYLSPSKSQTTTWSATRLGRMIRHSPGFREKFCSNDLAQGIWRREFKNGSMVTSTYAKDDPDRARGNSADRVCYDEGQDIDLEVVQPIVSEATANSNFGYLTDAGTPKHVENPLEHRFRQSTQREWVMRCPACSSLQYLTSSKCIDKPGIRCCRPKCAGLLNPREGTWVARNLKKPEDTESGYQPEGYHIPQVISPLQVEDPRRWARILQKKATYSEAQLDNEVMGVAVSLGSRMLTEEDLEALCRAYTFGPAPFEANLADIVHSAVDGRREIYAGVDWSGEGLRGRSFTALWINGVVPGGLFKTLYYKVFPLGNPVGAVAEIAATMKAYGVRLAVADAGNGGLANPLLAGLIGPDRLIQVQYGAFRNLASAGEDRIFLDKTAAIDTVMLGVKNKYIFFPLAAAMREAFKHILAPYEHVTNYGRGSRVWIHSPEKPDDAFQSLVYAWFAARIGRGELKLYDTGETPTVQGGTLD